MYLFILFKWARTILGNNMLNCDFFLDRKKKGKHVEAFRECFGKLAIFRSFLKEGQFN